MNPTLLYSQVYLLDDQLDSDASLQDALFRLGYEVSHTCGSTLPANFQRSHTDILCIRQTSLSPELLIQLKHLQQQQPMPLIIFTDSDNQHTAEQALQAGASAYLIKGLQYNRLASVIRIACMRFETTGHLQQDLARAERSLDERKLIEQAKGLVMQHHKCDEQQAFTAMRNMSMQQSISLAKLARQLITALEH
ncbi:ANTAR domain-containing response regulator [Aliamphritea spongicola]|uniref:ANTAR domain-containing response regulator n=1 Tax=Aliamphritea spongicola TaxID=707589 RepID=UPI00196AD515|nr:ANTAR domain-containing protein [Aliamphritea spongicola]MBN3563246.1 ANTAR domain-containing protein [Aliamphritea spongicola]